MLPGPVPRAQRKIPEMRYISFLIVRTHDSFYSSSTFTGLPVAMDSLQAMVKATDLKASR